MKKIVFSLLLLMAVGLQSTKAQENPTLSTATKVTYWYYPSTNVYYNESAGEYWYYDEPSIKWMYSKQLPSTYVLTDKDVRYQVNYNGPDVWKDNKKHKIKYKKDGTIRKEKN